MRVALVDHRVSAGGVTRFLYALLSHLADAHPEDQFVLFSTDEAIARDDLNAAFGSTPNVDVAVLPQSGDLMDAREEENATRGRPGALKRLVDVLKRSRVTYDLSMRAYRSYQRRFLGKKPWYRFAFTDAAIAELGRFDVVFFAWPFFMEPADMKTATVGTFHDLHFKHFPESYNPEMLRILQSQVGYWLCAMSGVVVSTHYIADEIQRYYPDVAKSVDVIYLAPYSSSKVCSAEEIEIARRSHGVPERYLIYSGGRPRHKNIIVLLKAISKLRASGVGVPLVITGIGTEVIGDPDANLPEGDAAFEINQYLEDSDLKVGVDIMPLGYLSGHDVDALTQGASAVVSASLYEAGCGPAMDSWRWGVPVAFSDIPPFVEQLGALGTHAWVFDPHDPHDVAEKIRSILDDPEAAAQAVQASKEALARYTWADVAAGYYDTFLAARARFDSGAAGVSGCSANDGGPRA